MTTPINIWTWPNTQTWDTLRAWGQIINDNFAFLESTKATKTELQTHVNNTTNPHSVTKAQVGLWNVDNTSDANKPISSATQTALNAKQDTLVSGTNIKTINGASVLWSGDLSITAWAIPDGSLTEAKMNASINASLDKADTSVQPAQIANFETTTQLNARDTANRARANHTWDETVLPFDTTRTWAVAIWEIAWDDDKENFVMGIDSDSVEFNISTDMWVNQTASTIPKGSPVYASWTVWGSWKISIAPFIADGTIPNKYFVWFAHDDILAGITGVYINWKARIRGIDTSAWATGTELYPSATVAWEYQTTPTASWKIPIAQVITSHATTGTIVVRYASSLTASEVLYDNTSGLTATEVQGAINELNTNKQEILAEWAFVDWDKTKLDWIETGAEVNTVDSVNGRTGVVTGLAEANEVVDLTTAQTVAWVKTFSSSPIVPTPTTDMEVATKKYVDDNAGGIGTWDILQTWRTLTAPEYELCDWRTVNAWIYPLLDTILWLSWLWDFLKLTNPATLPTGTWRWTAFSPDSTYLSVAHTTSPFITIYKRSWDTFTKLTDPATLPTSTSYWTAFSPDWTYLSVAHNSSPFVTIYKRSWDTFTKLANPSILPAGTWNWTAFSPDWTYLSVSHYTSPFITIYKRSWDTFTKLANPSILPANVWWWTAFSTDWTYLSVGHSVSPFITIYKRSWDTFTKLANPATLPASTSYWTAFSPDNTYLSVAHSTSPFVTIYKRSWDTFTKLTDPATLPASHCRWTAFSPNNTYLSVAHESSPFITIYKQSLRLMLPDLPTNDSRIKNYIKT